MHVFIGDLEVIDCPFHTGNFELGVHIADVSFFVGEDNALDAVASQRATSVYMVQKVSACWNFFLNNPLLQNASEVSLMWSVIFFKLVFLDLVLFQMFFLMIRPSSSFLLFVKFELWSGHFGLDQVVEHCHYLGIV